MSDPTETIVTRAETQDDPEEMTRYGINCIPVNWYHFGKYRYSSLKYAIAEAKRQEARDLESIG